MQDFLKDFKAFVFKGNVVDVAIAFIIGGAFKTLVGSLVKDIFMPPIGLLLGGVDFKDLKYILQPASDSSSEVAITYGIFLQNIVDLMIIGFSIFVMIKVYETALKKKEEEVEETPPEPSNEEVLLTEIRDLLKK